MNIGLAIDYGTSMIRAELVDRQSGKTLGYAECPNRLSIFGVDILSRIAVCEESEELREKIYFDAREGLREALSLATCKSGVDAGEITETVLAANTTHLYLLLRQDPSCIMYPPYNLPFHAHEPMEGSALELNVSGLIHLVPCKANYLGGDMLCAILASGLQHARQGSALLDLGVNGELVVTGRDNTLYAGSCAAGCALGTSGFSASELVGAAAKLAASGVLNRRGRLQKGVDPRIREVISPMTGRTTAACDLDGQLLYQSDLAAFIQAKASVATMVDYMLNITAIKLEDIPSFTLTGALGCALDTDAAKASGLLPDRDYIQYPGAVLKGAKMLLCSEEARRGAEEIYSRLRYIQLHEVEEYFELMLPHLGILRDI